VIRESGLTIIELELELELKLYKFRVLVPFLFYNQGHVSECLSELINLFTVH